MTREYISATGTSPETDDPTRRSKAEELRESAARHESDARESFERCDTDGFVSQWASGLNAQRDRCEADIQEAGGVATFGRYALEDLDGNRVAAKLIRGKFGPCWALLDSTGEFTGEFVGAHPRRASTLERKGYREAVDYFVAEAVADLWGTNATNVQVITRPKDRTLAWDLVDGLGDTTPEG